MPRTVADKNDLPGIISGNFRTKFIQNPADGLHNFEIGAFVVSADVVGFTGNAGLIDEPQGFRMVFDVEPVADIFIYLLQQKSFEQK